MAGRRFRWLVRRLGRFFFRRYKPPRAILTVYQASHLEPGWTDHLASVYAVSAKLVNGTTRTSQSMRDVLDAASSRGVTRHGWGFHYCRTTPEAVAEAEAAAAAALDARVGCYFWNCEKHWAGSSSEPGADDPVATSIAFADTFKARAPGILLAYNAFTNRAARNQGSPHHVVDSALSVSHFDVWAPMVTATRASTIAGEWRTDVDKYKHTLPGLIRCPMVGSGRTDQNNPARNWGYYEDQVGPDGQLEPGLRSLVAASAPQWIAIFYGNHSAGMLTAGNDVNPPLVRQIPGLHLAELGKGSV